MTAKLCIAVVLLSLLLGTCSPSSQDRMPGKLVCCSFGRELINAYAKTLAVQDSSYTHRWDSTTAPINAQDRGTCLLILKFLQVHGDTIFGSIYAASVSGESEADSLLLMNTNVIERTDSLDDRAIRLLTHPKFYFINGMRGNRQLVVKHRISNGNMYFAVLERYYDIDAVQGRLRPAFSIESVSYMPLWGESGMYVRRMYSQGHVEVFSASTLDYPEYSMGEYDLVYDSDTRKYNVVNQHAIDSADRVLLQTSHPDGLSGVSW